MTVDRRFTSHCGVLQYVVPWRHHDRRQGEDPAEIPCMYSIPCRCNTEFHEDEYLLTQGILLGCARWGGQISNNFCTAQRQFVRKGMDERRKKTREWPRFSHVLALPYSPSCYGPTQKAFRNTGPPRLYGTRMCVWVEKVRWAWTGGEGGGGSGFLGVS